MVVFLGVIFVIFGVGAALLVAPQRPGGWRSVVPDIPEPFGVLGVGAAIAIAMTVALAELASRVEKLDISLRSTEVVEIADLKSLSTARMSFYSCALLVTASFTGTFVVSTSSVLAAGGANLPAAVLGLLLGTYLLVQLVFALDNLRGRNWLEPMVREVRRANLVDRIGKRKASTRGESLLGWLFWWVFVTIPLPLVGLAAAGDASALAFFVPAVLYSGALCFFGRTFGRDLLTSSGVEKAFHRAAFVCMALAMSLLKAVFTASILGEAGGFSGPLSAVIVCVVMIVVCADLLTSGLLMFGCDGLGPMRGVVWREVGLVQESTDGGAAGPAWARVEHDDLSAGRTEMKRRGWLRFWGALILGMALPPMLLVLQGWRDWAVVITGLVILCSWATWHLATESVRGRIGERYTSYVEPWCAVGAILCSMMPGVVLFVVQARGTHDDGGVVSRVVPVTFAIVAVCLAVTVSRGLVGTGPFSAVLTVLKRRQARVDSRFQRLVLDEDQVGLLPGGTEPDLSRRCGVSRCEGSSISL